MRRIELLSIVLVVLIAATTAYYVVPSLSGKPSTSACSGGPYNTRTTFVSYDELGKALYNLTYTQNGTLENGLYYSSTSGAISWIRSNAPANAVFLNWWDYGKEIIGCTGRSSVISNPSAQLIALGFTKNVTERDSNQSLADVGTALFTTNSSLSHAIVSKYGASYILIETEDGGDKAPYILQLLGLNPTDYVTPSGASFNPADWTSLGRQTVIYRLLTGEAVVGFTQVYSDSYVKIFQV